jgi:probable lipoprotein (TIGR04455 family)
MIRRWILLVLLVASSAACSSVGFSRVADDFGTAHQSSLFRLHVVVAPAPAGDVRVGEMTAKMAQRYVNQHRDYIAKAVSVASQLEASACGDGIEGVLHLHASALRNEDGAQVHMVGRLLRCSDNVIVWEADVADEWDADDANLIQVRAQYVRENGASVEPFVAPIFHALRGLLDTLPRPKLEKEADIDEKIEVGQ